jgi:hypothetical protein
LLWPTWAATEVPRLLARLLVTQEMFARLVLDAEINPPALDTFTHLKLQAQNPT